MTDTGLLRAQSPKDELSSQVARLVYAVDWTPWKRIGLFVASILMTTWLYYRNLIDGHLFDILSRTGPDGLSNAAALRASWWANYHHHFLLAVLCIAIGSTGVYYGLRSAWLYLMLGNVLIRTWNAPADKLELDYVPKWRDKSYGWSPITGSLFLIYCSTISFAVSMVAVYDMLQNKTWTIIVAVGFAVLGVVANFAVILTSFFRMLAAHKAVESRLREKLTREIEGNSANSNPGEFAVAALDLSAWRQIPVSSFSGTVVKVVPGLYALVQFVIRDFFSVRH